MNRTDRERFMLEILIHVNMDEDRPDDNRSRRTMARLKAITLSMDNFMADHTYLN